MTDRVPDLDERDLLAAELAFGLLDGDDLVQALELRRTDAPFDALVARWEAQAATELQTLTPVAPPAALWQRIDDAMPHAATILPFAAPRADAQLGRKLAFWRTGGDHRGGNRSGAGAGRRHPIASRARTAGRNRRSGDPIGDSANRRRRRSADRNRGLRSGGGNDAVKLAVEDGAGVVPEFWIIPADGTPRSLGRQASNASLTQEQRELVFAGGQFAVSLEPDDGKTSAVPRGRVLGAGAIQLL